MTTAQPNLLQLAQQGNLSAILDLLNQSLPKEVASKVSLKQDCLKIMLESIEAPDQATSVEFVRRILVDFDAKTVRQVKVFGREIDEDFPSWQEEFELVPPALSTAELAKQGDIQAIHALVNQWLNASEATAKVSLKAGCLRVMLEAIEFSDPDAIAANLFENVKALAIENCAQLKISGREPGDEFPDWQKEFDLSPPASLSASSDSFDLQAFTEKNLEAVSLSSPSSQASLLALAKNGDAEAIANVLNYLLRSKGLTAIAKLKGNCLFVTILADEIPNQEQSASYILKILDELKSNSFNQVKLYGKRHGATFAAWTQDLNLQPQTGSLFDSMFGAVTGAVGAVGDAANHVGGAIAGTATSAAIAVGNTANQVGGAITGTATSAAIAVGNTALQATDGAGFVLDMITSSPQLQELTKAFQVDKYIALIDKVDVVKADRHVKNLPRKFPKEKPAEIAHRIMMEKAIYVGGSGFASSLVPGFAAALFAVDLAATMAVQAEMIYQIAAAYGLNLQEPARKAEVLAIFGMSLGGSAALKAGLGFARNIPGAGAAIGASTNAAMLYALGYGACRFYEAKLNVSSSQTALKTSQAASEDFLENALNQQVVMDQILVHLVLAGKPRKALQQILPELEMLNLSSAALSAIATNPQALPPLENLLEQLNQDFAISLMGQCKKIAQADGIITPQEAKVLKMITNRFGADLANVKCN